MTERAKATSNELLQHLEHRFLYDYFRAKRITEDPGNRFGCQAEAETLVAAIFKFRDTINADDRFVRYKVLVGFESVYPDHWTDEEFDTKEPRNTGAGKLTATSTRSMRRTRTIGSI